MTLIYSYCDLLEHFLPCSVLTWCCLIFHVSVGSMFLCSNKNGRHCKQLWQLSCSRHDASCLLSDNHLSGRFMEMWWLQSWLLILLNRDTFITCCYDCGLLVPHMWQNRERRKRRRKKYSGCSTTQWGLTQLMCYPSLSLPPTFLCASVLSSCLSSSDVRWWCALAWPKDYPLFRAGRITAH